MKTEWQRKKLGDLYRIGSSKRVLKSQWKTEGVPFYRGREITLLANEGYVNNALFISENLYSDYANKYGVPNAGDIVITAIGTIGNAYIVKKDDKFYFKDASVLWLSRASDVDSEFIHFWISSPLFIEQLEKGNGATVDTLTIQKLQSLLVNVPPPSEQKRIVKKLDEVFKKVGKAKEAAEKNLQNSKELFESYLQSVFAKPGKDWEEKRLKEICEELFAGGDVPKKNSSKVKTEKYDVPIYANGVKDKGLYGYTNIKRVVKPSVTISARGTIGYSEIRNEAYFPVVRLIVLVPNPKIVDVFYLYYITRSFKFSNTGTSIPQLTIPMVENLKIALPSLKEQKIIVQKLERLSAETKKLENIYEHKLADLEELKKSVLASAFAGKL